jgi:Cellulase M and related proteins
LDKTRVLELIAQLSDARGAPGFEDEVLLVARRWAKGLGEISEDSLRNLYIGRAGNTGGRPTVLLDAHSDETAFMVHSIRENGTLKFVPLGDWVDYTLPAHKVLVRNARSEWVPGVIASKPIHYMTEEETKRPVRQPDMSIDVGACSYEEAAKIFALRPGEPVVPDTHFSYDEQHDLMWGKAFDCRLGCAALLGTLDVLKNDGLNVDIVAGISTQEELSMRGAVVTARSVAPDIAIVFEGCPADDTCVPKYEMQTRLKYGPMLRHMDGEMLTNPRFMRFALGLAEQCGIPVQDGVREHSATNGASIHLSNRGVPTIVIGLPVRYIHTHVGIAAFGDYENAVRLSCAVIRALNADTIGSF